MTELFDKKFVHFMWDDSLKDKEGFFSDSIHDLIRYVDNNSDYAYGKVSSHDLPDGYPFAGEDGEYIFFYYDPNYACKVAYAQGKQIQYMPKNTSDPWRDIAVPLWSEVCEYRVKPEQEKKWRPFQSIAELKQAWDVKRSPLVHPELEEHTIWVRDKERPDITRLITDFNAGSRSVALAGQWHILEALFDDYEFLDGTPCGVEE